MKSTWALATGLAIVACHGSSSAPDAAPSASSAPIATTIATPAMPESAAPSPAPEQSAPLALQCGAKDQPPCPMQRWMKSVMSKASASGDLDRLAAALDYVADRPPPGMDKWTSIARTGATQARANDERRAKQSCQSCHNAYKKKYRATLRDRAF